jgi:hypothetical protein
MMTLGFVGLGFMGYLQKNRVAPSWIAIRL